MIVKSIKVKVEANKKQLTLFAKHAGTARHAYNWGLDVCENMYQMGMKKPNAIALHKMLVADCKNENKWYYDVSKCAPQQALRNLDTAFDRFFNKIGGYPKYKKKYKRDSFYLEGNIQIEGNKAKLPKIGWVKLAEDVGQQRPKNATISRKADQWFISFKVEFEPKKTVKTKGAVGVDLGIKTLATLSDGTTFANIRPYKKMKSRLRREQRKLSRKYVPKQPQQSKNYKKQRTRIARLHKRISDARRDCLHKLTSYLAKNHSKVVIEDLNIKGMSKNRKLASAILDGGFFEFRRQLEYKSKWYGCELVIARRFFPSSKTCSSCGNKKDSLELSERTYCCHRCGMKMDRDLNAAKNLSQYKPENTAVSQTATACGASDQSEAQRQETRRNRKQTTNVKVCVSSA